MFSLVKFGSVIDWNVYRASDAIISNCLGWSFESRHWSDFGTEPRTTRSLLDLVLVLHVLRAYIIILLLQLFERFAHLAQQSLHLGVLVRGFLDFYHIQG